jgi:hypothetical protein
MFVWNFYIEKKKDLTCLSSADIFDDDDDENELWMNDLCCKVAINLHLTILSRITINTVCDAHKIFLLLKAKMRYNVRSEKRNFNFDKISNFPSIFFIYYYKNLARGDETREREWVKIASTFVIQNILCIIK